MTARDTEQPTFSIVIPVYNAEQHLSECLDSIVNQTIGMNRTQIILINDGSEDDSGTICEAYKTRYPDQIVYERQSNRGVSSARNRGIELATGKYIGFIDADDYVSNNYLEEFDMFFKNCSERVQVAVGRVINVGSQQTRHYLDKKFDQGTRVISLKRPLWCYVTTRVSPSMIRADAAKRYRFDENVTYFEDTKYITSIISETLLLGVILESEYYYRHVDKRTVDGSSQITMTAERDKRFYLNTPKLVSLYILESNRDDEGAIPPYYQYVALIEMRWRLFYNVVGMNSILDKAEHLQYDALNHQILSLIEDATLMSCNLFHTWQKIYLLSLKYERRILDEVRYSESGELEWQDYKLFDARRESHIEISDISITNDAITMRMLYRTAFTDNVALRVYANGKEIDTLKKSMNIVEHQFSLDYNCYVAELPYYSFSIDAPDKTLILRFTVFIGGREYPIRSIDIKPNTRENSWLSNSDYSFNASKASLIINRNPHKHLGVPEGADSSIITHFRSLFKLGR